MTFKIKVKNLPEINQKFEALSGRIQKIVARRAVKKGAEPIHSAAVGKVPVGQTGNLADSIKIRTGLYGAYAFEAVVAVDKYYGHFVEYGHKLVRGKKVVGTVPAKPFLRPAFDGNADNSLNVIANEISRGL